LPSSESGHFLYSPYLLDAVVHVAGFLVNCGLKYPEDIGFLASSFESWHILKPILPNKTYTSYSHMEESANGSSLLGDVYVFDGKDLVCALTGLRFQKMKKVALTKILQSAAPRSSLKIGAGKFQSDLLGSRAKQSSRNKEWTRDVDFDTPPSSVEPSAFTTPKPSSSVSSVTGYDEPAVGDKFLAAVAAEVGCEISELEPDTVFGDLGVDSLMAITVIASIRNDTGVELPGSFFLDNPTVAEATKALGGDSDTGVSTPQSSPNISPDIRGEEVKDGITESSVPFEPLEIPQSITTGGKVEKAAEPPSLIDKPAATLLLQGSMSSTEPPLFLLADGTGSVSSYIQLPAISGGRRIYGVESPFVRDPSAFVDISVGDLADAFVASIRKVQPVGPYIIGGYSLGAIHAFEVSRRLLNAGETVSELLLMANAAPVSAPADLRDLKISTEMVEKSGIAHGTGRKKSVTISARQKQHLTASIRSHVLYEPLGFTKTHRPVHTTLVIASKGLGDGSTLIESPITSWIHASWVSSETLGWDGLVGEIHSIYRQDIDSFSLLKYPNVSSSVHFIQNFGF
jgi:thioesterase domain-containing protein/acyl carrier protein